MLEKITKDGIVYFINIEKVDFHGPIVDGLEFIFDKIDVKEVSGALNLGNNLGVRVESKKANKNVKPSAVKMKEKSKNEPEQEHGHPKTSSNEKINMKEYADLEKKMEEKLKKVFPKKLTKQTSGKNQPHKGKKKAGKSNDTKGQKQPVTQLIDLGNQIIINPGSVLKLKEDPGSNQIVITDSTYHALKQSGQMNIGIPHKFEHMESIYDSTSFQSANRDQEIIIKPGTVLKLKV